MRQRIIDNFIHRKQTIEQLQQPLSAQTVQRRRPLLFGKASGSTGISAARIMGEKAVFYIENVNSKCSVNDIQTLVKSMKVNVISLVVHVVSEPTPTVRVLPRRPL